MILGVWQCITGQWMSVNESVNENEQEYSSSVGGDKTSEK